MLSFARLAASVTALFEPNPVLRRELRARWRRPAAFLTLFFYAAPLAMAMAFLYGANAGDQDLMQEAHDPGIYAANAMSPPIMNAPPPVVIVPPASSTTITTVGRIMVAPPNETSPIAAQLDIIGKKLFTGLGVFLAMAWLLIAPATAAPMLAMERERGLLEALHLANLPARRVALGKWVAAMAFSWTLLFVPLPIIAICFLFGGVSQMEFAQVTGTIFLTALNGAALGLFFSARRSRPATALRDTFLFVVVWSGLAYFAATGPSLFNMLPLRGAQFCALAMVAHPVPSLYALINNQDMSLPWTTALPGDYGAFHWQQWPITELWVVHIGLQASMALIFLWSAIRATGRALPEPMWVERRRWVENLRARWQATPENASAGKPVLKQRAQSALLVEIPLLARLERPLLNRSFANPVFGRELRARLRLRGAAWWLWLLRIVPLFIVLLIYIQALANAFYGVEPRGAFMQFAWLGLCVLSLYAAVTGAGGFTRERESGTWEGIRLSLLRPAQILHGKFWPLAGAGVALSLPFLFGLLMCVKWDLTRWDETESGNYFLDRFSLWHALVVYAFCLGAVFFASATALLISWFSRRTSVAVGLTICALSLWFAGVPGLFYGVFGNQTIKELGAVNPVAALLTLSTPSPDPNAFGYYTWYEHHRDPYYDEPRRNYREAVAEHRQMVRGTVFCPAWLLVLGIGELLLIGALMRQKFREEK